MPASSKEFLDIQATIECGFTLKRVRDMTRTYSHFGNRLKRIGITAVTGQVQKTALLKTARILRKGLKSKVVARCQQYFPV